MSDIKLMLGDCLERMKEITDGSVDLVLVDPPYGTVKGASIDGWKRKNDKIEWDIAFEPVQIFEPISRILRQNGKAILFSQEPYTSRLISSAVPALPFAYRAVWIKNVHANSLMAKKAMVSRFEDVNIFSKHHDQEGVNELRAYFSSVLKYIGFESCKEINRVLGHRKAEHCFYVTGKGNGSSQFSLCTAETYAELIDKFGIDRMDGFLNFKELEKINEKYTSTFNLWQGNKSKSNVLEYTKDSDHYHPTQKPIKLLEDLIQTFSNPGDTVLDFTMGSGSTGVACVNTGRKFIGIELDDKYFEIAQKRIEEAQSQRSLFDL